MMSIFPLKTNRTKRRTWAKKTGAIIKPLEIFVRQKANSIKTIKIEWQVPSLLWVLHTKFANKTTQTLKARLKSWFKETNRVDKWKNSYKNKKIKYKTYMKDKTDFSWCRNIKSKFSTIKTFKERTMKTKHGKLPKVTIKVLENQWCSHLFHPKVSLNSR